MKFAIAIVVAALTVSAVQAVQVTVCQNSTLTGPLARTVPTKEDFTIELENGGAIEIGVARISMNIDDSQGEGPKNVVVLNSDKTVAIEKVVFTGEHTVEAVCVDHELNLLVVTVAEELEDKSQVDMAVEYRAVIRDDGEGLYEANNAYIASFSNKQASLIAPCFDEDKHDVVIGLSLRLNQEQVASSPVTKVASEKDGLTIFEDTTPMKISEFSFEISPKA